MVMKIKNSTTASHRCVLIAICFLSFMSSPPFLDLLYHNFVNISTLRKFKSIQNAFASMAL